MLMRAKVKMVCSQCGSEGVLADAHAQWDVDSQLWEVVETYHKGAYCSQCDAETRIEARAVNTQAAP
jgi:hypothetical protein